MWCGVKGHDLKECWKRAPATAAVNTTAIASLQEEMKGIKKSVANVDKLQTTVDSLGEQMSMLIKWQQAEANLAIVKSKETAALAESLSKRVEVLESSQFTRPEEWVDAEFATVKDAANAALP